MKILFVHEVNYSVKPIYEMHEFPEHLASMGHEVAFWHFPEGQSMSSNLKQGWRRKFQGRVLGEVSITLYSIPFLPGNFLGRLATAALAHYWARKVFKDFNPDVVVSYSVPTQGWQALRVSKRMGIPYVLRSLDVSHLIRKSAFSSLVKRAEHYIYRNCDLLSANNSAMLRYCLPEKQLGKSKGVVHFPPLDLSKFAHGDRSRGRALLKLDGNDRVVMYMGTFFYFSGLGEVIAEFMRQRNTEKLILVGGGEQDEELRKLARELGGEGIIAFPGYVSFDQLPDILSAADVAINPMEQSLVSDVALPNKVLQYLAASVPTVSTPLQGLRATLGDLPELSWASSPKEIVERALKVLNKPVRDPNKSSSTRLLELFSNATIDFEKTLTDLTGEIMRFMVLGSSGMLGSELSSVAKEAGLEVLDISRSGDVRFDAASQRFTDFSKQIRIDQDDFLVNAIGWIPQKASGNATRDAESAQLLNTKLVEDISKASTESGFRWLQIGTDCVYSGDRGGYSEASEKDANDLYGISKISGEKYCSEALLIRCSIIGAEYNSTFGLYSWFKSASKSGPVKGFENHIWNGVTTNVFAKLAVGLSQSDLRSCNQHFVPNTKVSKFELLRLFAEGLNLPESSVEPFAAPESVNRTLRTLNHDQNLRLWKLAGYDLIPDIDLFVREMIQVDSERGA